MKFRENTTNCIRVMEQTRVHGREEMDMFNVQRVIAPKAGKPELRFMCSAHCLMVLHISVVL